MLCVIRRIMVAMLKGTASLALAGVILWQVAIHSGPQTCTAYVHVTRPNVLVTVDGSEYHIGSLDQSPIACELGPGRHLVRMCQTGQVLYEEEFTLARGTEIVLVASERPTEAPSANGSPTSVAANLALARHQRARARTRP